MFIGNPQINALKMSPDQSNHLNLIILATYMFYEPQQKMLLSLKAFHLGLLIM